MKKSVEMNPDVVFVGAGPVGLWTAIQLKLANPKLKILMREKYSEYQRKHILLLDKSSYKGASSDKKFQQLIKNFPRSIRTNDLEDRLLNLAKEAGIEIEFKNVENCQSIVKEYPNTKIFVGSDGSHSIVRREIFSDQLQTNKNLQYIIELKYEAEGDQKALSLLQTATLLPKVNHFVTEYVGKPKEGKTPVSVRIFVDKETYEHMKNATFKNPYKLRDLSDLPTDHRENPSALEEEKKVEKIPSKLKETIINWLGARDAILKEKRLEESFKITATHLDVYASEKVVESKDDKVWLLVGDAALGVPFFRSLNNGLLCGTKLAQCLNDYIQNQDETSLNEYEDYSKKAANNEISRANLKDKGIHSLQKAQATAHFFSYKVPSSHPQLPLRTKMLAKEINRDPQLLPEERLLQRMKEEISLICEYITGKPINVIGGLINETTQAITGSPGFANYGVIAELKTAINTIKSPEELFASVVNVYKRAVAYADFKELLGEFINNAQELLSLHLSREAMLSVKSQLNEMNAKDLEEKTLPLP